MGEEFQVPETILSWINGRIVAAGQEATLNSIHIADGSAFRVTGTVKKFGISADIEIRFRIDAKDSTLIIKDIDMATSNPIGKTLLPQMRTVILAKGREFLAPLSIEIEQEG